MKGRFTDDGMVRAALQGGHGTFTLVSPKSQARYTYRLTVDQCRDGLWVTVWWLYGTDNEVDYARLARFPAATPEQLLYPRKAHSRPPSWVAFDYLLWRLFRWPQVAGDAPSKPTCEVLEIWHHGVCGRCGRKLTTPESIQRGLGPKCAARS